MNGFIVTGIVVTVTIVTVIALVLHLLNKSADGTENGKVPTEKRDSSMVVDTAVEKLTEHHTETINEIDDAEDSDTPATDTAEILNNLLNDGEDKPGEKT